MLWIVIEAPHNGDEMNSINIYGVDLTGQRLVYNKCAYRCGMVYWNSKTIMELEVFLIALQKHSSARINLPPPLEHHVSLFQFHGLQVTSLLLSLSSASLDIVFSATSATDSSKTQRL